MTPTKVHFIFLLFAQQTAAWAPQYFPKQLRCEEQVWRFPDATKIQRNDATIEWSQGHYMDETCSRPEPTKLRHSNAMASADYMMEMRSLPSPGGLRHSDISAPYLDAERLWGAPRSEYKPLMDNIMIAPRLSDYERTWMFPKTSHIISSEVRVGTQVLDPFGISDEHVKTHFVETEHHLPDWKEDDVIKALSKLDENVSDFKPPETKEKVTLLFYQAQVHLPGFRR